jgi:hypothetical protein
MFVVDGPFVAIILASVLCILQSGFSWARADASARARVVRD